MHYLPGGFGKADESVVVLTVHDGGRWTLLHRFLLKVVGCGR
jgi:hypothetical protein